MFTYTVYMHVRKITCKIYVLGLSHDRAVFARTCEQYCCRCGGNLVYIGLQKIFLRINVRWKNF